MLLYASYAAKDYNYKEYVDPAAASARIIEDDIAFEVLSPEILDEGNLGDYLTYYRQVSTDEIPNVVAA